MVSCLRVLGNPWSRTDSPAACRQLRKDLNAEVQSKSKKACGKRWLRAIGGPTFYVIETRTIERLGFIPRHDVALKNGWLHDLDSVIRRWPGKRINFLSHTWSNGTEYSKVDTANHDKAKAMVTYQKYYEAVYDSEDPGLWWVDWSCIDQANTGPGAAMLPAFIKLSDLILCFIDRKESYYNRGWCAARAFVVLRAPTGRGPVLTPTPRARCRMERAMFTAMCSPRNWYYFEDSTLPEDQRHFQQVLGDPTQGALTMESDRVIISKLTSAAREFYAVNKRRNFDGSNDYSDFPPQLSFEQGFVWAWDMSSEDYIGGIHVAVSENWPTVDPRVAAEGMGPPTGTPGMHARPATGK